MEISISNSNSFGGPSNIIARPCMAYFRGNNRLSLIPIISPTTKNIFKSSNFPSKCSSTKDLIKPVRINGQSRFSISLSYNQHNPSPIQDCSQAQYSASSDSALAKTSRFGSACYKFLRPYAVQQAIISAICLFARVLVENPQFFKWPLMFKTFPGLVTIILAHAYYIGLNQIYDADIDRVNKPYLPIPTGELSDRQAWFLVIFYLLSGLLIMWLMNADLITLSLYCLGLFFGTFYSAPPFRFKRYSLATSIFLPLTTGAIHNVGILYATRASIGLPFWWSPPIVFITTFVTLFFVVISITKDLTDVEGDMKHNIQTFAAIFGLRKIAFFCTGILLVNYMGAIAAAIYLPQVFKRYLMLPAHSIFPLWLLFQVRKLDKENYSKEACANFFQFLWKLLNLEYLLFPFI
ncbi:homogentisate solanesyltransferase, chloroplastic [Morus notabilis]|uniref:homogentisate solanesyltransferase, chloroplastic n=1 Tax=Morus notabilis TaxID=981085 RepID=UPI000CECE9BC|nr:homogentisate solanesyltransferase, chloroplastic [Morus notabilis]